jgi:sorbitol-specific phosphotransferase system component IIBC
MGERMGDAATASFPFLASAVLSPNAASAQVIGVSIGGIVTDQQGVRTGPVPSRGSTS